MPLYTLLVHRVQILLSGFLSTLAHAHAVTFGSWFVGSTPTGVFHSLATAHAGRTQEAPFWLGRGLRIGRERYILTREA